jgi:hypothetical protein
MLSDSSEEELDGASVLEDDVELDEADEEPLSCWLSGELLLTRVAVARRCEEGLGKGAGFLARGWPLLKTTVLVA